jgi:hypothetical protein
MVASERRKVVRAACPHDCPDTCAMLVTVEDGGRLMFEATQSIPSRAEGYA